jgi:hypothetical protein
MSIGKGRPLRKPKKGKVIFGKDLIPLVEFYNAFINGEIISGNGNELLIGDLKIIWKVKGGAAPSTPSGDSQYRGEYTPDGSFTEFNPGPFVFGDIVRITPTNVNATTEGGTIIPGVYICVKDAPTISDLPIHPMSGTETTFWHWLSTYPSASVVCNGDGTSSTKAVDMQDITPAEE